MKLYLTIFVFSLGLFYSSCNIINPDDPIPTYIKIDSINVYNEFNEKITSKVTTGYISYANSTDVKNVGVFRLPFIIPVITNEDGQIYVLAGVDNDGRVDQSYYYPFYTRIDLNIKNSPGDTIDYGTIDTKIKSGVNKLLFAGFEAGNDFVIEGPDSAASLRVQNQHVASGNNALEMQLGAPQKRAYFVNTKTIPVTINKSTYLSFDYLADVDFGVVIFYLDKSSGTYREYSLSGVRHRDQWNKIYFNLLDEIGSWGNTTIRIGFIMFREDGDPDGTVYLDNVEVTAAN